MNVLFLSVTNSNNKHNDKRQAPDFGMHTVIIRWLTVLIEYTLNHSNYFRIYI